MSGENLVKFLLGTLDRVRDRALGMLGSGSPRSLAHRAVSSQRLVAWDSTRGRQGFSAPELETNNASVACDSPRPRGDLGA